MALGTVVALLWHYCVTVALFTAYDLIYLVMMSKTDLSKCWQAGV